MKRINLKGAVIYEFQDSMKALGIFTLTLFLVGLINIFLPLFFGEMPEETYFGGLEFSGWIYMLIVGLISVRQDLRLFLQNGRGRHTVFLCQLIVALLGAVVLSLGGPVLNAALKLVAKLVAPGRIVISSFEALFMQSGTGVGTWESMEFNFLLCIPSFFVGMFISLLYYRLTKRGKILVSIAVPAVLFVGLPMALANNAAVFSAFVHVVQFFTGLFDSPLGLAAALSLLLTVLFALFSWLLLRRAPVKAQG